MSRATAAACINATEYRAAILLNNAGAALLERGCYRQALETLTDAVTLMKQMTDPRAIAAPTNESESCLSGPAWEMLNRAELRLAQPQVMVPSNNRPLGVVRVYSHWDEPDRSLDTPRETATLGTAIRIDSISVGSHSPHSNEVKIKALIMVQNCAVAFRCASWVASDSVEARFLNQLANQRTATVYAALRMLAQNSSPAALSEMEGVVVLAAVLQEDLRPRLQSDATSRQNELADISHYIDTISGLHAKSAPAA